MGIRNVNGSFISPDEAARPFLAGIRLSRWSSCVLALAITALSVLLRWIIVPLIGESTPYLTVLPTVIIISVVLGMGSGLAAGVLGVLLTEAWLIPPAIGFNIGWAEAVRGGVVLLSVVYLGHIGHQLRAARARAEEEARLARVVEQNLRESEERYRSIFENSLDGILLSVPDGHILAANREACRMHGFTEAEMIRLGRDGIIDRSDPRVQEAIRERALKGSHKGEHNHIRKDGTTFPCEVSTGTFMDRQGRLASVIIFRDITQRVESEKALRDSEKRLRAIIESAEEAIVMLDDRKCCLEANPAAGVITGIPYENLVGKSLSEFLEGGYRRLKPWSTFIRTGRFKGEVRIRHISGSYRTLEVAGVAHIAPGRHLFVGHDITERKRAEEELSRSRDELEERVQLRTAELEHRNRELQDFAFIASHDLREPLRKIQAFGDLIITRSGDSLAKESVNYLHRMRDAAGRMEVLLESLLAYSRVTTKGNPFSRVDLAEAAKEALSNLEIRIKETNASIVLEDLPRIEADHTQLVQLFQNLFSNALKFHKQGEIPMIRVCSTLAGTDSSGDEYEIQVADNGIGFDEQYLDKIFKPFQRLHGRTEYEGVGMGLAICKKIVERHCGSMTARSTPGGGATFIVTLPATQRTMYFV